MKNVILYAENNYFGLFSYIGKNGVVKNLNIDSTNRLTAHNNVRKIAALAGINLGTIENCTNSADFGFTASNVTYLAGIAGAHILRILPHRQGGEGGIDTDASLFHHLRRGCGAIRYGRFAVAAAECRAPYNGRKSHGQTPFIAVFHSCFILPAPLIFTMIENSTFPRASEGNLPKFKVSLTQTALLLLGPSITMVDANT